MDTTMAGEKAKAAQLAHWDPKQPEKHSNLGVSGFACCFSWLKDTYMDQLKTLCSSSHRYTALF